MMKFSHVFTLLFLMIFSLSAEAARVYREGVVARPNAYENQYDNPGVVRDNARPVARENAEENIQDDEWEDG